jgi:hypothetical protein
MSLLKQSYLIAPLLAIILLFMVSPPLDAQHTHGNHPPPPAPGPAPETKPTPAPMPDMPSMPDEPKPAPSPTPETAPTPMPDMPGMPARDTKPSPMADMPGMSGGSRALTEMRGDEMLLRVGRATNNFISMNGFGSGTSWQPASTPMYMWQQFKGNWLLMYHAEAKLGVNSQNGPRGVTKFESQNWFMPMAIRQVGPGTLQLRGMFSFEPFTFSPGGSPQLFQTGETFQGRPLVDKQHPHDLFMTLSATYTIPVGEHATWFSYLGMPGEPALGPVAFMHRSSASENPSAPLSHHLQDSTHISFGVFTTGFTYRWLMVEGSAFNGREPDEKRYGFEFHPWNSQSLRVSVAPTKNLVAQWSYGWLDQPEASDPGSIRRMTASISYNRPFPRGNWASSLIWGRNVGPHGDTKTNSYLAETTVNFLDRNYLYSRVELTDKNELLTEAEKLQLGFAAHSHPNFRIAAFTLGGARDIWTSDKMRVAIGADATFYKAPEVLHSLYGERPAGFHFFLRIRPGRMRAESHGGHAP